jgi:hypothetical protein
VSLRRACAAVAVVAATLLAWACGARTAAYDDDDEPRDASVDRPMDTSAPPETCEIETVSAPIDRPPGCAVSFSACRPRLESVLIASTACGQLPAAVWTGEALVVGWDALAPRGRTAGVALAAVGLDGRVRSVSEPIEENTSGRGPSIAWSDVHGVGLLTGTTDLAWFDAMGQPFGAVAVDRSAFSPAAIRVTRDRTGVFRLLAVNDTQPYLARARERPGPVEWSLFSGRDVRQAELVEDASGFGTTAAFLGRNPREIQLWGLEGGSMFTRLSWEIESLLAGIVLGDRVVTILATDDPSAPTGAGAYLAEAGSPVATFATDASGSAADLMVLGDDVIAAVPVREGGDLRIGLFTLELSSPPSLGDRRFVVGEGVAPRSPQLVLLPDGFAVVHYQGDAGISLTTFECCAGG